MAQSTGKTGELAAQWWFKQNGWIMFRHQPPTRIARSGGKTFTIQCRSDGVADFTGYTMTLDGAAYAEYRACEVKEAHGDTMPCSRLAQTQREWMCALPSNCAWVGVMWMDGKPEFEMFRFKHAGSYHRGTGGV